MIGQKLSEIDAMLFGSPDPPPESGEGVTSATVAEWCGTSAARIGALARTGQIPRRADKTYDLRDAVRAYCRYLRDAATAKRGSAELQAEKVRVAKESADKLALQNAKARGDLLDSADVAREWAGILRDVRAAMLAVPSRVGSRLPHLTPHDVAEITREVSAVLTDLADGDDHAD